MEENRQLKSNCETFKILCNQAEKLNIRFHEKNESLIRDMNAEREQVKQDTEKLRAENQLYKSFHKHSGYYNKYIGKRSWLEKEDGLSHLEEEVGNRSSLKKKRISSKERKD